MKKSFSFLLSTLCASAALAEPPSHANAAASALVQKQVIQPLKNAEAKRSKFSRSAPPPRARRIRVLDTVAQSDVHGKQFVRFAIDVHHRWAEDDEWAMEAFLGCVYVDQKAVFVQQGSDYVPARSVVKGDGEAQPDVCEPAAEGEAQVAAAAKS